MECLISDAITTTCDKKKKVGGVNKRLWIGNVSELESIAFVGGDPKGAIESATLATGAQLYKFEGFKQSHTGGYTTQKQVGGNTFFQHDVFTKFLAETAAEKSTIEDLSVADLFICLETNTGQFVWYGFNNGMELSEGVQNTGAEYASDITDQLTFTGAETVIPKPLQAVIQASETQYEANLAYMESLETPAP